MGYQLSTSVVPYAANNPVGYVDPHGLKEEEAKTCCCCCAKGLSLNMRKKQTERYGHIFEVHIDRELKLHPKHDECTFEWWEWTDNPPDHYPEKCKDRWCELHSEGIQDWIFDKWKERDMKCPGCPERISVWDSPRLVGGRPGEPNVRFRTIYFVIRVLSSAECVKAGKCERASFTRCAVQYLKVGPGGKYRESFFKFIACSPGEFNNPPAKTPPNLLPEFQEFQILTIRMGDLLIGKQ